MRDLVRAAAVVALLAVSARAVADRRAIAAARRMQTLAGQVVTASADEVAAVRARCASHRLALEADRAREHRLVERLQRDLMIAQRYARVCVGENCGEVGVDA